MTSDTSTTAVSLEELVRLCANDGPLFADVFFKKTARQRTPDFHREIWDLLENPSNRLVNLLIFRGAAKTSIARMFTAKRMAYGLAHTIVCVSKSEGHAARSIKWIKKQIEYNSLLCQTFGLRKGSKWQDTEIEIIHGVDQYPIWLLGMGITGSTRGVNFDDYRPDFILLDDPLDEENTATPEQRQKVEGLIYGALKESLAPRSENPDAKMAMLQTPLNREDAAVKALNDPEWASASFGCWTPETALLPLEKQKSIWPERWSDAELRDEKRAYIARNQLSIFLREKECRIVSPETSAFKPEWLQFYDVAPEGGTTVLTIDPVPPPSDIQIAKGLRGKDSEALAVVKRKGADFYVLEISSNKGHEPDWTIMETFRLWLKYHPRKVIVETTAYQRTLEWLLRKAMETRRQFFVIEGFDDRRKKFDRIVDGVSGVASNHRLHVRRDQATFIQQFNEYPDVPHDDELEAVAVAVSALQGFGLGVTEEDENEVYAELMTEEQQLPELEYARGAP